MSDKGNATDGQSIEARLEELTYRVQDLEAKREQVFEPKLERQAETIATLETRVDELEAENKQLRAELDSLGELGADKQSTPKKRMLDLRKMLMNKAKVDHESGGDGMVAWTYSQVVDQLESHGHGKVYAPQAYDAMEDAAEAEGFGHGKNQDGDKVVRVNWTALPAHATVNEINNDQGVSDSGRVPAND